MFDCSFCHLAFNDRKERTKHRHEAHFERGWREGWCMVCHVRFGSYFNFNDHFEEVHIKETVLLVKSCSSKMEIMRKKCKSSPWMFEVAYSRQNKNFITLKEMMDINREKRIEMGYDSDCDEEEKMEGEDEQTSNCSTGTMESVTANPLKKEIRPQPTFSCLLMQCLKLHSPTQPHQPQKVIPAKHLMMQRLLPLKYLLSRNRTQPHPVMASKRQDMPIGRTTGPALSLSSSGMIPAPDGSRDNPICLSPSVDKDNEIGVCAPKPTVPKPVTKSNQMTKTTTVVKRMFDNHKTVIIQYPGARIEYRVDNPLQTFQAPAKNTASIDLVDLTSDGVLPTDNEKAVTAPAPSTDQLIPNLLPTATSARQASALFSEPQTTLSSSNDMPNHREPYFAQDAPPDKLDREFWKCRIARNSCLRCGFKIPISYCSRMRHYLQYHYDIYYYLVNPRRSKLTRFERWRSARLGADNVLPRACRQCKSSFPGRLKLLDHIKEAHPQYLNEIEKEYQDKFGGCETTKLLLSEY